VHSVVGSRNDRIRMQHSLWDLSFDVLYHAIALIELILIAVADAARNC